MAGGIANPKSSPALRALNNSARPALVFGVPLDAGAHAVAAGARGAPVPDVVDLRALDTPTSDVALRNSVRAAWRAHELLVVRVDGAPSAQVLALLHGLVRGELRFSPDHVERMGAGHRVIALTDASAPSEQLLALFPLRVRAAPGASQAGALEAACR